MDDEAPDPFADLFSSSSSTDLFRNHIKSTSTSTNATVGNTPVAVPGTPTGTGTTTTGEDDFGSFISVPPSLDPLHQPEPFSPIHPTSPVTEIPSLSFVEAAKLRHGENERRVLGELLMHQDDPLYWITSSSGEGGERSGSPGEETEEEKMKSGNELIEDLLGLEGSDDGNDEGPPSPPPSPRGRTPVRGGEEESESHSRGDSVETDDSAPSNNNSHNHPHHHHHSHSSDSSGGARKIPRRISHSSGGAGAGGTLSRKFTSFLSSSLPSPPSPTSVDSPTTTSFSHSSTNIVRALTIDSTPLPSPVPSSSVLHTHRPIPNVTHRNPFSSSHLPYSPPTGAPGFVPSPPPDHRLEKSKAEQMGPVVLKGRKESTSMVLTSELAQTLRAHLPPLSRLSQSWTLLYSLDQHGISLGTFYKLSWPSALSTTKGALVVIQDTDESIFGVWVGEGIHLTHGGHYGGGDSFLWKEAPASKKGGGPTVKLFKWTGRNDYVALCESDFVSFGGGEDGKTGIYLDKSLLSGTSAKCRTFDNDVLCGPPSLAGPTFGTTKFEVLGIEVWGMGG